jgi:hypothetical protein
MAWKLKEKIPPRPESIDDLIDGDPAEVEELDLRFKGLERLPDDIDRLVNLKYLQLSSNKLTTLPDGLVRLRQVRRLSLQDNPLADLPEELGALPLDTLGASVWTPNVAAILRRLPGLRRLWLFDVDSHAITEALALTPNLTALTLAGNGLAALPDVVLTLPLTSLMLLNQALLAFPDLREMKTLVELDLVNCNLTALPTWIGGMNLLRKLNLSYNDLIDLPSSLADFPEWIDLDLSGNPLTPQLVELAKQGANALFAYLRERGNPAPPTIEEAARNVPGQRLAPFGAAVRDGRLVLVPEQPSADAGSTDLPIMHEDVRDWAQQAVACVGANHGLIHSMLKRHLDLLGASVVAMQVLKLALSTDRLERVLSHYYEDDGRNPLTMEQRGVVDALIGNTALMLRMVPEWRDKMGEAASALPVSAQDLGRVHDVMERLADMLDDHRSVVDAEVPQALREVALSAEPPEAAKPPIARAVIDSATNALSILAREALSLARDIGADVRKKSVSAAGTSVVTVGGCALAVVAGGFLLGNTMDLAVLAQTLPADLGWLKAVLSALNAAKH